MRKASQSLASSLDTLLQASAQDTPPPVAAGDTTERIADALKELEDF